MVTAGYPWKEEIINSGFRNEYIMYMIYANYMGT